LTGNEAPKYSLYEMKKSFLASVVVLSLASAVLGLEVHPGEGSNMPDCCKKAQSRSGTPEVSIARLCCSLNCSEPGSSSSSGSVGFSRQQGPAPSTAIIPTAARINDIQLIRCYTTIARSPDSNPKYIQHLALLI
jgi:hypothetical protein